MPNYVSHGGVWHAAKEKVALVNRSNQIIKNPSTSEKLKDEEIKPGDPFIYEGPDRAALYQMWKDKVENYGTDFRKDPEFLQAVRNMGYTNYQKYLKDIGFDEAEMDKKFNETAETVHKHELPKKVAAIDILGGGKDFSGSGQDIVGGFGDEKVTPKQ